MKSRICNNCFFKQSKRNSFNDEIPAWCWRFDHETNHNGYCNDKYFLNKIDGVKKYKGMNPKIAGYFERKNDDEGAKVKKIILSVGLGLFSVVITTLL